jgi:excisionase family DNA binding protein
MAENEARLLTTGKAAELLGVTPDTVLRWVRKGRLTARYTAGGHCRIRFQDLEPLLGVESHGRTVVANDPCSKPLRCWEYLNPGGGDPEECKNCIVYRARVTWCFRLAELEREVGHLRRFCTSSCEECAYYRRVNGLPTNVLVISSDAKLISRLAELGGRLCLRFARNSYCASAILQDFHPGFVILDEDLWQAESDLVDCLAGDPRLPGMRIILAVGQVSQRRPRSKLIVAVLEKPFGGERVEQVIHTIPIEPLPCSTEPEKEGCNDAS